MSEGGGEENGVGWREKVILFKIENPLGKNGEQFLRENIQHYKKAVGRCVMNGT